MTDDKIERASEAAHNAWLAEKLRRLREAYPNISPHLLTWPNERGFEQLKPWAEIPDDVKEFDRIVIRACLQAIEDTRS